MAHPKVKISDNNGNVVSVTNNKLDVNAVLSASDNIEIGNVDIKLNGTNVDGGGGSVTAGTLRVTIAADDPFIGGLYKVEDAAHSSGNAGIQVLAVRQDTLANIVSHEGDYASLKVNSDGALYVDVADGGVLETAVDGLENSLTTINSSIVA